MVETAAAGVVEEVVDAAEELAALEELLVWRAATVELLPAADEEVVAFVRGAFAGAAGADISEIVNAVVVFVAVAPGHLSVRCFKTSFACLSKKAFQSTFVLAPRTNARDRTKCAVSCSLSDT